MSVTPQPHHPLGEVSTVRGRVITTLTPEGYVAVDGLLVRAALASGEATIGDEVLLRHVKGSSVLAAHGRPERAAG